MSSPLIEGLFRAYSGPQIDLLVNSDTVAIARSLPHISEIHTYSYQARAEGDKGQTLTLYRKLFRRYDLAISLTASDRSVLFALIAGRQAISAVESNRKKSWWKRLFLTGHFEFDSSRHIIENNTKPLGLLGLTVGKLRVAASHSPEAADSAGKMLAERGISEFIIFHPGAQYDYKVYPETLRNALLEKLSGFGVSVVVTGSKSTVDMAIKQSLPKLDNVHDFIGLTTLDELIALSDRSLAYIGADTLNMHIAAAQNRRVFAIFGPTILSMWSPWCNELHSGTSRNAPVQTYGNITIFQAAMPCIGCGKAGCDDHHGKSDCLYAIDPETILNELSAWLTTLR
ncbi:MAG: glycosyltransferase family 9 protein [Chlorobaculum sp.]